MIFPRHCKEVGLASSRPYGERVYFLSRYLIHETRLGHEVLLVEPDQAGNGLMRDVTYSQVLANTDEVGWYPQRVNIHDRTRLVTLARESGDRCTIFTGHDEHTTFVLDPDISSYLTVHVYDNTPPLPSLSAALKDIEAAGLFGSLEVVFQHHIRDITQLPVDAFPCRAGGFSHTLDADRMEGGERIAACLTGTQLFRECYGTHFTAEEICPIQVVDKEPFITRCCRREREGIGRYNGRFGAVVHWGAEPYAILRAVHTLVESWRGNEAGS